MVIIFCYLKYGLFSLQFPQLLFTDFVMFGIFLQVLSNASTPSSLVEAITPYEASSTMYERPGNYYKGQFFTTELKDISYRITAMSDSGESGFTCKQLNQLPVEGINKRGLNI